MYLGYHHRSCGARRRAALAWQEAVGIFGELADPHAARFRAELLSLTETEPSQSSTVFSDKS
jgi:hypothetical protein